MTLPKTESQTVEERRKEITSTEDEYLRVIKYSEYDQFPEVVPHKNRPENIRFFPDGLEVLVSVSDSDRFVGGLDNPSPVDTRYTYKLIDETRKKILEYSLDTTKEG